MVSPFAVKAYVPTKSARSRCWPGPFVRLVPSGDAVQPLIPRALIPSIGCAVATGSMRRSLSAAHGRCRDVLIAIALAAKVFFLHPRMG